MMSLSSRALAVACVLLVSMAVSVSAHGWLSTPSSRQDQCKMGTTKNCGNIQYEPQSVENVKGKMTCNGDVPNWAVLADDTMPWVVQPVGKGITKFAWTQTAIHPAANWVYYIGNTKIGEFLGTANTQHCLDLSAYSGRQKILAVWNIADTVNAFYSCVDVDVGAGPVDTSCVGGGANTFVPVPVANTGCTSTTTQTSYIVAAGDTLASVAMARGLTVDQLLVVNPLKTRASVLEVGTSIIIPPTTTRYCSPVGGTSTPPPTPSSTGGSGTTIGGGGTSGGVTGTGTCLTNTPTTYTVKSGESLALIATRAGITLDDLMRMNSGLLSIGQSLQLPFSTCSSTGGRRTGSDNSTDPTDGFNEGSTGGVGLKASAASARASPATVLAAVAASAVALVAALL